jgi:hypothetical protein
LRTLVLDAPAAELLAEGEADVASATRALGHRKQDTA